jgi:N-acetylmuramoyl-L-alanine amidase
MVLTAGNKNYDIPVYMRQGTLYFSLKHFADALSVKSYYNSKSGKSEHKFPLYSLKVTAKNPYIILTPETSDEAPGIYQLPTSSYLINGQIYIPAEYSVKALAKATGLRFSFKKPNKLVVIGDVSKIAYVEKVTPKEKTGKEKADKEKTVKPEKEKPEKEKAAATVKGPYNITALSVDEKANGTLVRIKSGKKIKTYNSDYKNGVLTVILRNATVDEKKLDKVAKKGLVKEVNAKNVNGDAEINFVLSQEYTTSEVINVPGSNDLLVTIHNKIFSHSTNNSKKEKWNFDVIVIDAGHGGKDFGAIGINGIKEKDVNLAIALKLGALIEKNMKGVKVVYTRDDDTFIELYRRGKIANEKGGKLFISVHCNSTPQKPSNATGNEVYLLRPGRTKEAISIAERENSVIKYEENPGRYQQLTDENFILVSMAHSSYMKYSEKYAELLSRQFSGDLNIQSRGVKQAGFYVLVGASMPSVLIETGFLSNKKDADYLGSKNGQQQYAESIFQSVKKFKDYYDQFIDKE